MKYIKLYEELSEEPKIGDYVLMRINIENYIKKDEVNNFINKTIGQIVDIYEYNIRVLYDNVPSNIQTWFLKIAFLDENSIKQVGYTRLLDKNQIVAIGDTPKDVEIKLDLTKYNI